MTNRRGRQSPREIKLRNNAVDRYYASAFGKEPRFQVPVKPLRERSTDIDAAHRKKPGTPLERHVLAAVLKILRSHPKVALVYRQQSGVFSEGDRMIRVGERGRPDVFFMLKGGRFGACEVKRPGGKLEPHQEQALGDIRAFGGIAFVAYTAGDVIDELARA